MLDDIYQCISIYVLISIKILDKRAAYQKHIFVKMFVCIYTSLHVFKQTNLVIATILLFAGPTHGFLTHGLPAK